MILSQQKLSELLAYFKQKYPNWTSFSDPVDPNFQGDEIDYKQRLIAKAQTQLGATVLHQFLETENYDGLIEQLQNLGRDKDNNLLFLRLPASSDLNILNDPGLDKRAFCQAVYDLLHGEGDSEERLGRYLDFVQKGNLPNKWTFPTYFLFLCHPNTEIFIKPSVSRAFVDYLGESSSFTSTPSAASYAAMRRLTEELKTALEPYQPRDMVDVQSFIWVLHTVWQEQPRYWKIAPGRDAWQWQDCLQQGFIGIGWDGLGDISNLSRTDFNTNRDQLIANHPDRKWSKSGVNQVWVFSKIKEGDRIVANRGTTEVLGVGTVVGPYYYDANATRYRHRLPVQWDECIPCTVNKPGWRRTLIELPEADFKAIIGSNVAPNPACPFTADTFDLLAELAASPRKTTYQARKDDFRLKLEQPFQTLLRQVADQLPKAIADCMETERKIFARIPKNDFHHGGAWPFYWGAFYPKGGQRTQGAQLFLWMNSDRLEFGFSFSVNGSEQQQRFVQNCQNYYQPLSKLLEESLSDSNFFFGSRTHTAVNADGYFSGQSDLKWQDWLKNPEQLDDVHVAIALSKSGVLSRSADELVTQILQSYEQLFPLVLLAISSNPISKIEEYLEKDEPPLPINSLYPLANCAAATYLNEKQLNGWVQAIHRKGQAILYGPPGTGKTFLARELAKHLVGGGNGAVDIVQFHPAYTYEDFIQGIRPKRVDGGLDYPIVPGRFLEFCKLAQACGEHPCVLIIDEINRANLSQVFGELMYLLEYRDQKVYLASGETFSIPTNVRLIGTMNTADRSIALVDHALRRRFAFLSVQPNYEGLKTYHGSTGYSAVSKLVDLLQTINREIGDPHYEIGTSFFLNKNLDQEIQSIWQLEIEPYLEEFFFDQPGKMNNLRWETVQKALIP